MNILKLGIAIVVLSILTSCSKDSNNTANDLISQATKTLVTGNWIVSNYNEKGITKTSGFANYKFTFSSDKTIKASNGATTISGTWQTGTDDSTAKFILFFNAANGSFEEISEDWRIVEITTSKIDLNHVSGGNGGTSLLTFTKI